MTNDFIEKCLKKVCKQCKRTNHGCVKNIPYIGLCVENDKDELIEIFRRVEKHAKIS